MLMDNEFRRYHDAQNGCTIEIGVEFGTPQFACIYVEVTPPLNSEYPGNGAVSISPEELEELAEDIQVWAIMLRRFQNQMLTNNLFEE